MQPARTAVDPSPRRHCGLLGLCTRRAEIGKGISERSVEMRFLANEKTGNPARLEIAQCRYHYWPAAAKRLLELRPTADWGIPPGNRIGGAPWRSTRPA